jgi:predicted metalloprotease with PDZ domain
MSAANKPNLLSRFILPCCALVLSASGVFAQSTGPEPLPLPTPVPTPEDIPYPGVIRLDVDATDIERHIFQVRETIPVSGGESLTLLYPEWLPAGHAAYGRVENLAGLKIHADGERVEWVRDPVNVFAFHVDVPNDAEMLNVEYQFVSAVDAKHGRIVMTSEMLNLQWWSVTLYPAGHFDRQIMLEPSVRVPEGWQLATALEIAKSKGNLTKFKPVSLETLIDSPIFAGRHFKRLDLNPGGDFPVHLNIVADREELLEILPEQLEAHRALVQQADKLFDSHHFDHYDFLFAVTDRMGRIGTEHHRSSENSGVPGYFTKWDDNARGRDLLPHEYTHSWNGKFRRPADLWTANYSMPMRGSLLWVYEGQTQYWGKVLTARAGLHTQQEALDALAYTAAYYDNRVGREWRTLQDNTNDPVAMLRRSLPWSSWQRAEDYYSEGLLIWLDADTLIRELSKGKKSLDNFAQLFFGINDGSFVPVTYVFEDVVEALNSVQPYDWETFLRSRLDGHGPEAPLDGIRRGGYKLVYRDTPSDYYAAYEAGREYSDLTYSLGISIENTGRVKSVLWEGPAFKKGLTVGNQLIAVNGIAYDIELLKDAIVDAQQTGVAIELLIQDGVHYRTVPIDYRKGLRYPHLERDGKGPAYLDEIFAPR